MKGGLEFTSSNTFLTFFSWGYPWRLLILAVQEQATNWEARGFPPSPDSSVISGKAFHPVKVNEEPGRYTNASAVYRGHFLINVTSPKVASHLLQSCYPSLLIYQQTHITALSASISGYSLFSQHWVYWGDMKEALPSSFQKLITKYSWEGFL